MRDVNDRLILVSQAAGEVGSFFNTSTTTQLLLVYYYTSGTSKYRLRGHSHSM